MKKFTLKFIQVAWVAQAIVILVFTMAVLIFMPPERTDRINLWLQFIPAFAGLIAAQGAAAGAGPLLADQINKSGARRADPDGKGAL